MLMLGIFQTLLEATLSSLLLIVLHDLVLFVQFKKREKHLLTSVLLVKLQAKSKQAFSLQLY